MAVVKRKLPRKTKGRAKKAASLPAPELEKLSLPTERSVPSTRIQDFTILLFGEKKIGKTDLTAQFDDTLHLMTEPGGKAQSIFQVVVRNWREFQGYVKLLEKDKRFRTVSVDTADLLYKMCFDYMMQKMGIEHPSEESYGKGWAAIRTEFEKWVMRLIGTGKGVIFVSHAQEKEIKMRGGEKYDRISPTMAGQARDVLEGVVDIWAYYGYDGSRRILTIQGSDHIGAGHRLKAHFRTPKGKPLVSVDMGGSAEEGYGNLIAAFNNKYVPPKIEVDDEGDEAPAKKVVKKKLALKRG